MKTIKALIAEELKTRASMRSIERDERVEDIYYQYPDLEKIDSELISLRGSRMLTIFEKKEGQADIIEFREKELLKEREEFISKYNIDPEFDEEKPICTKCMDTGFYVKNNGMSAVCTSCMSSQIKECYDKSGLADFSSYDPKNYDRNYFGDKTGRNKRIKAMLSLFESECEDTPLRVYYDVSGSGKTFLSVIVTKYAINEGKSACFLKAEELLDCTDEKKEYLKKCDFVIIDDYSADVTRKWQIASNLNNILDARIASKRPTVLVSSSPLEQLSLDSDLRIAQKIQRASSI